MFVLFTSLLFDLFCSVYKYPLFLILFNFILFSSISKADVLVQQSDKPDGIKRGEKVYVQPVSVLSVLFCPLSPVFLFLSLACLTPELLGVTYRYCGSEHHSTLLRRKRAREREREGGEGKGRAERVGV